MSGPICPECTTFALIETHGNYSCPICGWSGKNPLRKIMDAKTSREISDRTRKLLDMRIDNKLRYVRVDIGGDDDTRSDVIFEIVDLLDVENIQGDKQVRFFVEGDKVKVIDEIQWVPGVEKVSVF
jgi:uncharacterized Zn finger protein (UPF0148 family)